jgi:hypothetical protein
MYCVALHDKEPVFKAVGESPKMQALLRDLGFKQPLPIQSTFIFKVNPNIPTAHSIRLNAQGQPLRPRFSRPTMFAPSLEGFYRGCMGLPRVDFSVDSRLAFPPLVSSH